MPPNDPPTRPMLAQTDRERLIVLDQKQRAMEGQMNDGTAIMSQMQEKQADHAIMLERINGKSTLAVCVLSIIAVAVIGAIVSGMAGQQPLQPIEVHVVAPNQ